MASRWHKIAQDDTQVAPLGSVWPKMASGWLPAGPNLAARTPKMVEEGPSLLHDAAKCVFSYGPSFFEASFDIRSVMH